MHKLSTQFIIKRRKQCIQKQIGIMLKLRRILLMYYKPVKSFLILDKNYIKQELLVFKRYYTNLIC